MVVVRLAWSKINDGDSLLPGVSPILLTTLTLQSNSNFLHIQFLDLTGVTTSPVNLTTIISRCRNLKRLSLEACELSDQTLLAIAENRQLEVLNLTMATNINAHGLRHVFSNCRLLNEVNLSSTGKWLTNSRNDQMAYEASSFVFEVCPLC